MKLGLIFSILVSIWTVFVIYCLFNGSKILVQTKRIKTIYWIMEALAIDFIIYYFMGITALSLILIFVMLIVTCLYTSIPSGYNDKGIYIRGLCYPYKRIEDMVVERIPRTCRLNFKCYYRMFYIDCDDYSSLKKCEQIYKENRNK